MPIQQHGYRDMYTIMLADHPAFKSRVASVKSRTLARLATIVNEHGSAIGSTNYIPASFTPTLNVLHQIKTAAIADPFVTDPRLARFAEFYLNLLTPREPRFGGTRKLVAFGDGPTTLRGTDIFGQLTTVFRGVNNVLSERLMGAWRQTGSILEAMATSGALKIDELLPVRGPILGDAEFKGWYTVLRHGCGEPSETATWLVSGDWYSDHANCDLGGVALYARGVPISPNWGSIYSPSVPGAWMRNVIVPESSLDAPWNSELVSIK
jgi:hypothetical protein